MIQTSCLNLHLMGFDRYKEIKDDNFLDVTQKVEWQLKERMKWYNTRKFNFHLGINELPDCVCPNKLKTKPKYVTQILSKLVQSAWRISFGHDTKDFDSWHARHINSLPNNCYEYILKVAYLKQSQKVIRIANITSHNILNQELSEAI